MVLKSTVPASGSRRRQRRLATSLCAGAIAAVAVVVSLASLAVAAEHFPDVPPGHPYADAIHDLSNRGIMSGYTNGNFGPDDPVMRQQFAKVIVGAGGYKVSEADICPFTDVAVGGPTTFYPDNFVAVCAAEGITMGKTATTFDPYAHITRLQVISMVVRAADDIAPGLLLTPPVGWISSAGWESDLTHGANAARAEYSGLLNGLDLDALDPYGDMSRGEVAQVLHNLLILMVQPPIPTTSSSTSSSTSTSTTSTTTTEPPQTGDLVHFWWTPTEDWQAQNVSTLTGAKIAGAPIGWQCSADQSILRMAAVGPGNDLLLFSLGQGQLQVGQVQNLSQTTGQKVAGTPVYWLFSTSLTDRLAVTSPAGDLLHFWQEPGKSFLADNITQRTGGPQATGPVAPLGVLYSTGAVEYLAARSKANDLVVFSDHPLEHDWQWANISSITGRKIAGSPVAWRRYTPSPELHIAAVGEDGALLHFTQGGGVNWQVEDLSAQLGRTVQDGIAAWATFNTVIAGSQNIAGISPEGHLLRFWSTGGSWLVEDLSAVTGANAVGPVSFYSDIVSATPPEDGKWYDHLVANSPSGDVLIWWDELLKHNWKVVNVTQKTGQQAVAPLGAWSSYIIGPPNISRPHLAGLQPD